MALVMNLKQFVGWLESIKKVGRFGWVPEFNSIGKLVRTSHQNRFKSHTEPSGTPWKKLYSQPKPRVGQVASMIVSKKGARRIVIPQKIRSVRGKKRAIRFREVFGPPFKPQPALIRTRKALGTYRTVFIRDFLTGSGFRGRGAMRITKTSFFFGFTRGSRWIERMQFGSTYRGKRVPARVVVGWTRRLKFQAVKIMANGYLKRFLRDVGRAA